MGGVCSEAIESQNVVGYTGSTSGEANNFVAIPFSSIGCNTADIQQIKLSDGGAMSIGWGTEDFSVWEGVPTLVDGSVFIYCDPSMDPNQTATDYYWGEADGTKAVYPISGGMGFVINCAADLTVEIAAPYAL